MSSIEPHIRTGAVKNSRTHPTIIRCDARYRAMNAGCRICFRGIVAGLSSLILNQHAARTHRLAVAASSTIGTDFPEYGSSSHKWLIALAVMLATTLEVLDTSIVNVALPHMQGSFSASVDEIAWVPTSYLVANGIMIPMTGWISSRFGRKRYFLMSVAVFVAASGLCGAAQSLDQMVVFRLIQGAAGAAMVPSSEAILMETFPPNEH